MQNSTNGIYGHSIVTQITKSSEEPQYGSLKPSENSPNGLVSGVESQPNEFIDFQWCSLSPKGDATLSTLLREHPLLISLVFIVFLSEPYWEEPDVEKYGL
jgi:hypothetical protein